MDRAIPCPRDPPEKCDFIEMSFIGKGEDTTAVDLIRRTFPHMHIDNWWFGRIRSGDTIVVKRDGKKMIGIANVSYGNDATLNLLAVDPKYKGMGLGSLLLVEAENMAKTRGASKINLMTEQAKPENVIFYSKNGYKIVGFDKDGYDHCPSVHFKKDIKARGTGAGK